MHYLIISFTHKNTDIHTREKLAFNNDLEIENFLNKSLKSEKINETVLLSTCNRVEIISSVKDIIGAKKHILGELSTYSEIDYLELKERADIYDDKSAIHHLFTVASALDSLVIGETQIVGQLKDAFKFSVNKGFSSQNIARAFHYAFKCAANVRNETALGTGSVSVSSTAVSQAKEIFKEKANETKALVIGAGEMSRLAIEHLLTNDFKVILTSRDYKKAKTLAQTFEKEIEVRPYDELQYWLNKTPLMFTATSAPYPIITNELVENTSFNRYWFDIAVPRDIDDIQDETIKVYSVDDLQEIVAKNVSLRAKSAKIAYSLVSKTTDEYFEWLKTLEVEPVVKHLHLKGKEIIEKKLSYAIKKGFINGEDQDNIQKLCETIMTEFLHKPTVGLKEVSKTMEGDVVLSTVQNIFDLKEDTSMLNRYKCEHIIEEN